MLSVPQMDAVTYERNFIKTAVCEIRFPTLLELETKEPTAFQKAIRKEYPFYDAQQGFDVGDDGAAGNRETRRYLFRSKDQKWTVALRSFSLALDTTKYKDFEDFEDRVKYVLDRSRDIIDADFFTRVGLRYINNIPIDEDDLSGLISPQLVSNVTEGVFGTVEEYRGIVQGYTDVGQYSFRHGILKKAANKENPTKVYVLDFDFFDENVDFDDVLKKLRSFHDLNFSFFRWCLGDKAVAALGKATGKR